MTAITQYYSLCFIPGIAAKKVRIGELLLAYWEENIKPAVAAVDTYTIDFAVSPDLKTIRVIELNHAPPTAGTALFDWDKEEDRAVISRGPFEVRVLEQLAENPLAPLDETLRNWMAELSPPAFRDKIREMAQEGNEVVVPVAPPAHVKKSDERKDGGGCITS